MERLKMNFELIGIGVGLGFALAVFAGVIAMLFSKIVKLFTSSIR